MCQEKPKLLRYNKKVIIQDLIIQDLSPRMRGGKHIVIVVILENKPDIRNWIVTAYITRTLSGSRTEWEAS